MSKNKPEMYVDRCEWCDAKPANGECDCEPLPYGFNRDRLTRYVLEWCWLSGNESVPAGIHDAAAILLNEPSLATGFAKQGFDKWEQSRQDFPVNPFTPEKQ